MKKLLEKHGMIKSISAFVMLIGFILFIVGAFISKENVQIVINVIAFIAFVFGGLVFVFQTKEHVITKLITFLCLTGIMLSWIFPYGYFQGLDFYDYGMSRIGFGDMGYILYNTIAFTVDKLIYLFVLAGFYGVLSITNGYQRLVTSIAKVLKNHILITSVVMSFIVVALTSIFSQTFAVLIIIPFLMAILLNMGVDKLTTFAITFGSMLVGILGATYGTESLYSFNYYMSLENSLGILYRLIIAVVAFVLYNFFICMRLRKIMNDKKEIESKDELKDVAYMVSQPKKNVSIIPSAIIMFIVLVFIVLGFVDWKANFNIDIFNDFHTWLTGLKIGDDFTIFAYLLSSTEGNSVAFGLFQLRTIIAVLVVASIIMAFVYRVKLNDYFEGFFNGMKQMVKPALYFFGIYILFVICYMSPFIPTITNWALNLTDGLNPYIASILAFITSLFHADLGYTAYSVGSFLTTAYASDLGIIGTIYPAMFGLVQMIAPTSVILVIGLGLMKVDFKSWFKYIWLFALGMFIILLVLFTVLTYMQ